MKSYYEYIKWLLSESEIIPPEIPNTMNFWHGGNLDEYNETISHKKGRFEYGAGLYITTHYETASKYSKGSRKLYLITVEKGNDLNDSFIDFDNLKSFISDYIIKTKQKEVLNRLIKYVNDQNKVKGYLIQNIILNEDAIKPTNTIYLRQFFIDNGIDYQLVPNAFGWGETMMVLYNMKKIVKITRINPKDKITVFDLPTEFTK